MGNFTANHAFRRPVVIAIALCGLAVIPQSTATAQTWKTAVGYDRLLSERGAALETGAGVKAALVEANSGTGRYMPTTDSSEFVGKAFEDRTGSAVGPSGHANSVGQRFFGNTQSMVPGVNDVVSFEANSWLVSALNTSEENTPIDHTDIHVMNHSYAGSTSVRTSEIILEAVDQIVDLNDLTSVVAGTGGTLIAPSYNSITVGRTAATSGFQTSVYGNGRSKPDIVAPDSAASYVTPIVSSAASLLHAKAMTMGEADGQRSETIKAVLMAGATKDEFTNWNRTTANPLDTVHGAGELNIYNSYHIMEAGQFDGATGIGNVVGSTGWDYSLTLDPDNPLSWVFSIDSMHDLSIMLNWNLHLNDNPDETLLPRRVLANLDLRLYDSSNTLIDSSLSSVDNLEHIYAKSLAAGTYRIEVAGDSSTDFALAWQVTAVPEPGAMLVLLMLTGVGVLRRSRSD
ncbi:hypothetical protein OAH18_00215 [bacterium]|nr:hypothetical protein [bacterium]